MSELSQVIKRKMHEQNLSQNRLSKLSGVSQSNISSILSNTKSPSIDTVRLLADALGCAVSELLGETNEPANPVLTADARQLLSDYASLSAQGREYIRQQMEIAKKIYEQSDSVSQLAE